MNNHWHVNAHGAPPTLVDDIIARFDAIANAIGFDADHRRQGSTALAQVMTPWGASPIARSAWVSDIADDHSPIEFSLCMHGARTEIRLMIEAQGDGPSLLDQRTAGIALNRCLAQKLGASLTRYHIVEPFFCPTAPLGKFSIWHSACFANDATPSFKVYLNPWADGFDHGYEVVRRALEALGFRHAWQTLLEGALARGHELDQLKYFALDLSDTKAARVKIYVHHIEPTLDIIERSFCLSSAHPRGRASEFVHAMIGDSDLHTRFGTSHSFTAERDDGPAESSMYVPIGAYAANDQVACDRFADYLTLHDIDPAMYRRGLSAFAHRKLEEGRGLHSYVAAGWRDGRLRATAYVSPEYFATTPAQ